MPDPSTTMAWTAGGPSEENPWGAAPGRRRRKLTLDRALFMAVFLGLPVAVFVIFVVLPIGQAMFYSLTDWTGFSPELNVIGLDNYAKLLDDETFLKALRNNVLLTIVVPFVTLVAALAIAVVVTTAGPSTGQVRGLNGSGFYRVVSFFPYAVPAVVIGLLWAQVYDPAAGLLNGMLTGIGLDGFKDYAWLGEVRAAMPASMFVIIWASIGFYTVLFVAAIKGVPAEIYEAARIDGAGRFRTAISITLPSIRDNVQTAYIYLGILTLDAYVFMAALAPGGGPANSTLTMSQHLMNTAFKKSQFGYATSMGVVLALVTLLFAALVFVVFHFAGGRDKKGDVRR